MKVNKTFVIPIGWSPNIGNAFFALGIKHALEQALPGARVELMSDQAAYMNFWPGPRYRCEPRNSLRYYEHLCPDYLVLAGSVLTRELPRVWRDTFSALRRDGTKLALIGAGHYEYSPAEVATCRRVLEEFTPHVLVSRDRETFGNLADLAEHAYDGIDGAYFLPDVFRPIPHDLAPYIVLNFDKIPEPRLTACASRQASAERQTGLLFNLAGQNWRADFSPAQMRVSRFLGKGYAVAAGLLGLHGTRQSSVGEFLLIRTDHQMNPFIPAKVFGGPNAFGGDLPYTYLNLYAQTELTLTDRVHAALVTMAYGKPAILFSRSGRASILDRLGATTVTREPTWLDLDILKAEKQAMVEFLKSVPW
jgi:hypothetical protein